MNIQADTKQIGFWPVLALFMLGPVIAPVFVTYSFGYWLERKTAYMPGRVFLTWPYAAVFVVINTLHNWTVCTILFREFPREFLTTSRMKRHKTSPDAWRRELADMMGGFLNSQDGGHY